MDKELKKKIIVTGASGFVGFHIINYLISKKYSNVIGISRSRSSNKKNFITADLTSAECINIIKNCEVLINCAYDDSDYKNNFTITNNLINASQYKNIKTIIHISTAVVSGLKGRHDINENTPNNPDNLYQKTKLKIENKLKENLDSNIKLLILRPTMIIGKNSNNLDFIINKYKKKAIHNLIAFLVLKMRNTNFISINNITDIVYNMIKFPDNFKYTNYILSQDDDLNNNYAINSENHYYSTNNSIDFT